MNRDELLMSECIKLALKGKGCVSPNPLVGSVVVKDDKIIGKGFHKKFGKAHAEVNAISDAEKNGYDVKDTSLYVNLEPCSHTGKTLPCADRIINKKISKVFIGMKDPFEEVNGKGIRKLKAAGIDVKTGILKSECEELNKFFIKYVTRKLPYVSLKIAQSIDGKIALNNFSSKWITGKESRKFVHQLRSEYDAVLIGKNTAHYDNPSLTVRDVRGRDPYRIVIDRNSELSQTLNVFKDSNNHKTYIVKDHSGKQSYANEILLNSENGKIKIPDILKELYKMNINSVLVEGGANLYSQFAGTDLFDEIYLFIAPKIIGTGISSFGDYSIRDLSGRNTLKINYTGQFAQDLLINYKNVYRNNTG
ncbi:MAG TPA: bifunctional diaminohydroxyphosphoribosylaminopyrimidine deaminase/5-amino-6-(5-phosphoribosylamino)uracil reductase RibD [Ignavibacteria bacterium]|nr:bifunctional diaminohydroxyphosphoribosylaminopyrimidine deaminase/5-amino-6-(5-phosphoribosylamino)uracil reductase RibD [Ignavibacteria bacterium]